MKIVIKHKGSIVKINDDGFVNRGTSLKFSTENTEVIRLITETIKSIDKSFIKEL